MDLSVSDQIIHSRLHRVLPHLDERQRRLYLGAEADSLGWGGKSNMTQLAEKHPKSWFRAFFNMGLINYIDGNCRMLPCEAGKVNFFVDPYGNIYSCNGLETKYWMESMGNIRENPDFQSIWRGEKAQKVRDMVRKCPKNCWMMGTASPVMQKYLKHPLKWVLKNKLRSLQGKPACLNKCWYDVGQDPIQGNLREIF